MEFLKVILSIVILILCNNEFSLSEDVLNKKHDVVSEEDDSEIFKPTFEWQDLKKDQKIPKGLHVQINLQTGERKAKLLQPTQDEHHTSLLALPEQTKDEKTSEAPIKKLPINLDNIGAIDPETISQVKQKYRSYKEIKDDFKELEIGVKTDSEIMKELMENFDKVKNSKNTKDSEKVWLTTLMDLEYLVHQVDNARLFTQTNDIENIVFPSLNSSSSEIRAEGGRLLGAACQNNVPSQIAALESGAIRVLLHSFSSDTSPSVKSSSLYALSCIIRNFPIAQKMLTDIGGLGILNSVFDGESGQQLKWQVKVVTLVNDLLIERREVEETIQSLNTENKNSTKSSLLLEEAKEKQRQYNLVNLETKLLEHQWCQHLTNILLKQISIEDINDLVDQTQVTAHQLNHDNIEKIIEAMLTISKDCQNEFKSSVLLKKTLSNLLSCYKGLSDEEINEGDTDGYYAGLKTDIENMVSQLL